MQERTGPMPAILTMTCLPSSSLGFDRSGRLLELAILTFDSGHHLVVHAMKARRQYLHLLE